MRMRINISHMKKTWGVMINLGWRIKVKKVWKRWVESKIVTKQQKQWQVWIWVSWLLRRCHCRYLKIFTEPFAKGKPMWCTNALFLETVLAKKLNGKEWNPTDFITQPISVPSTSPGHPSHPRQLGMIWMWQFWNLNIFCENTPRITSHYSAGNNSGFPAGVGHWYHDKYSSTYNPLPLAPSDFHICITTQPW